MTQKAIQGGEAAFVIAARMQPVLLDLPKEIRRSIVFFTYDLDEALRIGDRIAILRDGEGGATRHRAGDSDTQG